MAIPFSRQLAGGICLGCLMRETISAIRKVQKRSLNLPDSEDLAAQFPELDILDLLGEGGMGLVYRVRRRDSGDQAALKILRPATASEDFIERFLTEARALAQLDHPGIVAIHDHGRRGPFHFILMELVEGGDLADCIRDGPLSAVEAFRIVFRICDALDYAHDHGVIHRDIKPANILLREDGEVKVTDFGLAKLRENSGIGTLLTSRGTTMGSPIYMAPEQRKGEEPDQRADIYALGVILYEMLTGDLPTGAYPSPAKKARTDRRIDAIVRRAMAVEPGKRYQRAGELRRDLAQLSRGPSRRCVLASLAGAGLAGFGATWWWRSRQAPSLAGDGRSQEFPPLSGVTDVTLAESLTLASPEPVAGAEFGSRPVVFGDFLACVESLRDGTELIRVFGKSADGSFTPHSTLKNDIAEERTSGLFADGRALMVASLPRDQGRPGGRLVRWETDGVEWRPTEVIESPVGGRFAWASAIDGGLLVSRAVSEGSGDAAVFRREGGSWVPDEMLSPPDPALLGRGFATTLALHGRTLVAGAPAADGGASRSGAAFLFEHLPDGGWTPPLRLEHPNPTPGLYAGSSVAVSDGWVAVGGYGRILNNVREAGCVFLFRRDGNGWVFDRELVAPEPHIRRSNFGQVLALRSDLLLVAAPTATVGGRENVGVVYVFRREEKAWICRFRILPEAPLPTDCRWLVHGCHFLGEHVAVTSPAGNHGDPSLPRAGALHLFSLERFLK